MILKRAIVIEDEEVNDNEIKLPEKAFLDFLLRYNYM